jgi:hypothetical protein
MRSKLFVMLVLLASLFFMCSKDDDTPAPTGPGDNGGSDETATSFALTKHKVATELPNLVTMLFQVTDLKGKGIDFLTLDRFQIDEEGQRINLTDASAYVLKKSDMMYRVRTKILIDNNAGTNLVALKKGAVRLVQNIGPDQEIAIYTVSDQLTLVLDYTSDVNALTGAINGIEEGAAQCNLYGSIMEAKRDRDNYELGNVTQYTYVIFTDSNDDAGTIQQDAIGPLTSQVKIYTVGFSNVDGSKLDDIGVAYFGAADETAILEVAQNAQAEIISYANSLYQLSYRSSLRNGSGHSIKLTISGNTNTESSAVLEDTFSSSPFVDVEDGLYVNWSYANPEGVDMVMVRENTTRTVKLLSMGGEKLANFTATSDNPNIAGAAVGAGGLLTLTAKGSDGDSTTVTINDVANNLTKQITVKIVTFQLGTVLFEKWENLAAGGITGVTNDPRYPDNPTVTEQITSWKIPTDVGDNYGTRIRGYLHPPTTGNYIFWISSDDQSQLFLSSDGDPENKEKVCEVTTWTNSEEWTKETNQKSAPIALEAGKHYYIETIHVEGTGGDNLAVAWQLEGANREVLTGDYLSLWLGD